MRVSPASASQRRRTSSDQTLPRPARFSSMRVRLGDHRQRLGVVEPLAALPLDHHVHGIGAGQLLRRGGRSPPAPAPCPAPGRRGDSAARAARRRSPVATTAAMPSNRPESGEAQDHGDDRLGRRAAAGRRRRPFGSSGGSRALRAGSAAPPASAPRRRRPDRRCRPPSARPGRTCGSAPTPRTRTRRSPAPGSWPSAGRRAPRRARRCARPSRGPRRPGCRGGWRTPDAWNRRSPTPGSAGVSTLMNRFRRKSRPPMTPSVHRMAIDRAQARRSASARGGGRTG